MGTWGAGLYDDDGASDLKSTLSLLCKLPFNGDRLLEVIVEMHGHEPALDDTDDTSFWLVLADQFERKGITSKKVFDMACRAIESGLDLKYLLEHGVDEKIRNKRELVLDELLKRLQAPRPVRRLPKSPKLPDGVLRQGEIYVFPTWNGAAINAWISDPGVMQFGPDGWGALIVVDCGRVYDWLPWCAITSLDIDPKRVPSVDDCLEAAMVYHLQTKGATLCVPSKTHVKRMNMQLIGRIELDAEKYASIISEVWTPKDAIRTGWSISSVAFNASFAGGVLPKGPLLSTICKAS